MLLNANDPIVIKQKIIQCALDLFNIKEFDNVKILDICKCADVSIEVFYSFFESKEQILNQHHRIEEQNVQNSK